MPFRRAGVAQAGGLTEKDSGSDRAGTGMVLATVRHARLEDNMPTYTVHVPSGLDNDVKRAERTIFVREGFNLPAFLFGPLFLVYRRLWRALLAWCGAVVAFSGLAHVLALPIGVTLLLILVLASLTGLEANEARRQALGRRGYIGSALVTETTRSSVERTFFAGHFAGYLGSSAGVGRLVPRAPAFPTGPGHRHVIGSFPQPTSDKGSGRP